VGESNIGRRSLSGIAQLITLKPRKCFFEFGHSHQSSVHGRPWALPPCGKSLAWPSAWSASRHGTRADSKAKGYAPLVDGTPLLHCFTTGGVSLANAERLHEQDPPKRSWAWRSCPIPPASAKGYGTHGPTGPAGVAAAQPPLRPLGPGPDHRECRFEDPQIEVRGLSLEAARIQYEGRQALSCNGCRSDRFGPIPSGAPLAKPRKLPAGMGPVRT